MTSHKTTCSPEPVEPIARWEWLLISALVVLMLAQMWTSIRRLSVTSDEIDHLHAGYRYLQCNDFGWNPEHPPLVKLIAALPLLAMHIKDPFHRGSSHQNSTRRMSNTNSSKNTSIVAARIVSTHSPFRFVNPRTTRFLPRWR